MRPARRQRDLAVLSLFLLVLFLSRLGGPGAPESHPLFFLDLHAWLSTVASGGIPTGAMSLGALLLVVLTVLWPGSFCRWLCPLGACQRLVRSPARPPGRSRRLTDLVRPGRLRAGILLGSLLAGALGLLSPHLLDPVALMVRAVAGLTDPVSGPACGTFLGLLPVALILLLAMRVATPWCRYACPQGTLLGWCGSMRGWLDRSIHPDRRATAPADPAAPAALMDLPGRRTFLLAAAGCVLAGARRLRGRVPGGAGGAGPVRPPGATPEPAFLSTCSRCGQCRDICPMGVIVHSGLEDHPLGLLTPRLDFARGYCPLDCTACQSVCPTGSLTRLDPADRRHWRVGVARTEGLRCLRVQGSACQRCREVCPFNAVSVGLPGSRHPPVVEAELCVGCGLCENVCPTTATTGRPAIRIADAARRGARR